MITLAGCRFAIEPEDALTERERMTLARIGGSGEGEGSPFAIEIVSAHRPISEPDAAPASIDVAGDTVVVSHASFHGELDPFTRRGRIDRRAATDGSALEIFLRVALGCALPLENGVLLHSAGVVFDDAAIVFCGRSGAGKSTLASMMNAPVLSDELVAIRQRDDAFTAAASGFWGTLDSDTAPRGAFPLHAIADLSRGKGVNVTSLDASGALRRLVGVAVVPPHPELWKATLRVLHALAVAVPVYELAWTPTAPNAAVVAQRLRARPGRAGAET